MGNIKHTCNTCIYFKAWEESKRGECRYNPPKKSSFPTAYKDYWCGKHPEIAKEVASNTYKGLADQLRY